MEKDILYKITDLRQRLHKIPEKSMEEYKTKSALMEFIRDNTALEIVDRGEWFYALKRAENGAGGGNPAAFRADMDAVCGKDKKPGHYCGHDGHSSILCGLALSIDRRSVSRDVYMIFQPGEETGQGAYICKSLIDEKKIQEIYGFHNIPGFKENTILVRENTFACASTGLEITMLGTPSHAAYPESGRNPGFALSRLLMDINEFTKKVNREQGFVRMTLIGMEIGSDSYGVSASEGIMRLTVRGESDNIFNEYVEGIKAMAGKLAQKEGLSVNINEIERFPATINHDENVQKIINTAKTNGFDVIKLKEPMRWSEDFGYYLKAAKGAFFGIGDGSDYAQLHTEKYEFPDYIIETAVDMFISLI